MKRLVGRSAFVCLVLFLEASYSSRCNFSQPIASQPVIIGGIGDSGTRGVRNVLELLGVRFCAAHGLSGDDAGIQRATHHILFGHIFPSVDAPNNSHSSASILRTTYRTYTRSLILHPQYSLDVETAQRLCAGFLIPLKYASCYLVLTSPIQRYYRATNALSRLRIPTQSCETLKATSCGVLKVRSNRRLVIPSIPSCELRLNISSRFGLEPRTATLLPEWDKLLRSRSKFIHVLRDGKDVALGDLRLITSV